jgi:hypothetical protein
VIQRATHIILAFLVFFSSAGFVLNKHFCQNELKSVALFAKATPCHDEKIMVDCPMHGQMEMPGNNESKGCCDDTSDYLKSETDQITQPFSIDLESQLVLLSVAVFSANIQLLSTDKKNIHYLNYKPPLIICDLPVELQTFRC